jgi:hypothetical protein
MIPFESLDEAALDGNGERSAATRPCGKVWRTCQARSAFRWNVRLWLLEVDYLRRRFLGKVASFVLNKISSFRNIPEDDVTTGLTNS